MSDRFDEMAEKAFWADWHSSNPDVHVGNIAAALRRVHNEAIEKAMATVRGITLTSIEPPMSQEAAFETCRQIVIGAVGALKVKEPT